MTIHSFGCYIIEQVLKCLYNTNNNTCLTPPSIFFSHLMRDKQISAERRFRTWSNSASRQISSQRSSSLLQPRLFHLCMASQCQSLLRLKIHECPTYLVSEIQIIIFLWTIKIIRSWLIKRKTIMLRAPDRFLSSQFRKDGRCRRCPDKS